MKTRAKSADSYFSLSSSSEGTLYHGLNVLLPPNSYVEILMPSVIVLGSGVFERCLGPEGGP